MLFSMIKLINLLISIFVVSAVGSSSPIGHELFLTVHWNFPAVHKERKIPDWCDRALIGGLGGRRGMPPEKSCFLRV